MSNFDAAHVCEGCNERPACVKVGYWVCGGRCYQDALRDFDPSDWPQPDASTDCVCGPSHDCRSEGCADDCEACCG